jgi:hypothetical protein
MCRESRELLKRMSIEFSIAKACLPSPQACLGRGIEGEGNDQTFITNTGLSHREPWRHAQRVVRESTHRVAAGRCSAAHAIRPLTHCPLLPKQAWGEGGIGASFY